MNKIVLLGSLLLILITSKNITAATLIQTQDNHRETTRIYIDGNKARIEMPHNEGYMVIDVGARTMQAVMSHQRTVVDMSEFLRNPSAAAPSGPYIDTYTKTLGLGPRILGYETEEYALYANDQYCGSMFVSVEAMRDIGLQKFVHAFTQMDINMEQQMASMTGAMGGADPCVEAERKAGLQLRDIGFPLKNTDSRKALVSVVTNIRKNVRLPANAFAIPAGYKVTNMAEIMRLTRQQMQNLPPEALRMMQQNTQPGQHDPYYDDHHYNRHDQH